MHLSEEPFSFTEHCRGGGVMEYARFILCGQNKKLLSEVKNILVSDGYVFTGYSSDPSKLLRHVRSTQPEMAIISVTGDFRMLKPVIEVIDDDLLAACILLLETRDEEVFEFLRNSRISTYVAEPVFGEVLLQITDISVANYKRVLEYEEKLKQLNDSLESRKVIEKAKWLLVEQEHMTEQEAFNALRKKSRDNRMPMRDIADAILIARSNM
jgi:AmiR/NasT family two-component response regulator